MNKYINRYRLHVITCNLYSAIEDWDYLKVGRILCWMRTWCDVS